MISDHSPVSLQFKNILSKPKFNWRFNPLLLQDCAFVGDITARIDEFLATNDNGEVSDSTLWEAFKVVLRGHIISFESAKKRELNRRLEDSEKMLPILEETYRTSLLQSDYNKILKLKYEHNNILSKRISSLVLKLKQKSFELGDKPERLLASQLRGEQAKRAIHKIKAKSGELLTLPKEIKSRFKDFYKELYSSKVKATQTDFSNFFDNLNMSQYVLNAIQGFPSGKAVGPDGFGCKFYKAFHKSPSHV